MGHWIFLGKNNGMYLDQMHTSSATISSGVSWNIPRVTRIFPAYERTLHNYFIPCLGKYSGQRNEWDPRVAHVVGCNTAEYTKTFLYSDWLYYICLYSKV